MIRGSNFLYVETVFRSGIVNPAGKAVPNYVKPLDGLRGLSALLVMLLHICLMAEHGNFIPADITAIKGVWITFGHSVDLFFVISGFLIPKSLQRHRDLRTFFKDRVRRIMPVFVFLEVVVFALGPMVGYKWLGGLTAWTYVIYFLMNLTFLAPLVGVPLAQQNAWTLTYEWAFYIFSGSLYWLSSRQGRRYLRLGMILVVVGLALCVVFPPCWYFLAGVVLSKYQGNRTFGREVETACTAAAFIAFFFCCQYVSIAFAVVPAYIFFAFLINGNSGFSDFLSYPPMRFLGRISYSLYLVHPFALYPFQVICSGSAVRGVAHGVVFVSFGVVGATLSLVLSWLVFCGIERPLLKLRAR